MVWVRDFGATAILRLDPMAESFESFPSQRSDAQTWQMLGRPGEVRRAESGIDRLTVYVFV